MSAQDASAPSAEIEALEALAGDEGAEEEETFTVDHGPDGTTVSAEGWAGALSVVAVCVALVLIVRPWLQARRGRS